MSEDSREDAFRLAGDRLGKFVVLTELGRGSMGVVYEVLQEDLKRKVALKVLPANITLDGKQVQRFHREAESVARLRHDNVIQIYEVGEIEGTHYFAMELVDGRPLDESFGRDRDSIMRAARIAMEAARGLAHAHERGVIHRDIKPSNLLVDRNGRVIVTDFGLARLSDSASLTSTDAIVGTPKYMAPEQILRGSRPLDGRADIYALAATLYHVVSGRPPFDAQSVQGFIKATLEERPSSPRKFNKQVPHDLATILLRCLEKDPGDRYTTAAELADDLERFLKGERIKAKPKGLLALGFEAVRRHRIVASLAAVAAIAVLLLLVLGGEVSKEKERRNLAEEIARAVGEEEDLDLAVQMIEDLAAEHPDDEAVRRAREAIYWKHAMRGLEDTNVVLEVVLESIEKAGRENSFWHLVLLIETQRFAHARAAVADLPEESALRQVFEARLAVEDGKFEDALALLVEAPEDPEPLNLRSYFHFVKGLAYRGLGLAKLADDAANPEWTRRLQEAKASLLQARASEASATQALLRPQIATVLFEVRDFLGETVELTDLVADFDARFRWTRRALTQLWGSMTPVEAEIAGKYVERVLELGGLARKTLLAKELADEAERRLDDATGRDRVAAYLLLAVARLRLARPSDAIQALNEADNLGDDQLAPYVWWGRSLVYRATNRLDEAILDAEFAIELALTVEESFADFEPLFRHVAQLAEEAGRRERPAIAKSVADFTLRALRRSFGGRSVVWANDLLERLTALADAADRPR